MRPDRELFLVGFQLVGHFRSRRVIVAVESLELSHLVDHYGFIDLDMVLVGIGLGQVLLGGVLQGIILQIVTLFGLHLQEAFEEEDQVLGTVEFLVHEHLQGQTLRVGAVLAGEAAVQGTLQVLLAEHTGLHHLSRRVACLLFDAYHVQSQGGTLFHQGRLSVQQRL